MYDGTMNACSHHVSYLTMVAWTLDDVSCLAIMIMMVACTLRHGCMYLAMGACSLHRDASPIKLTR
jgi:hypothetical protein